MQERVLFVPVALLEDLSWWMLECDLAFVINFILEELIRVSMR